MRAGAGGPGWVTVEMAAIVLRQGLRMGAHLTAWFVWHSSRVSLYPPHDPEYR